jgi:hypothetical protein
VSATSSRPPDPAAYVENEWFPNHVIEATTRENYRYILDRYLLPELGSEAYS